MSTVKSQVFRRRSRASRKRAAHKSRRSQPLFSIEQLRARMLVKAYLDQDYTEELSLARSLANAWERRATA